MTDIKKEDSSNALETTSGQLHCSKRLNRTKAIRQKCLECCVYQRNEVKLCTSYDCPLWRYRMGKEERDDLYYLHHPLEKRSNT